MMGLALKVVQEKGKQRFLIKNNAGVLYQVSNLVYSILLKKQQLNSDDAAIAASLNRQYDTDRFTAALITETLQNVVDKIRDSPMEKKNSYILFRRTLIKEGAFLSKYQQLSKLFNARWLVPLSCLSILVTVVFFSLSGFSSVPNAFREAAISLSIGKAVLLYAAFMAIILLHEVGHAAASYSFGIKPREIGIGLYLIFPVLYTNVSGIWQLNAKKRLIVNFAGIYFQLLINLLLLSLYFLSPLKFFWLLLICANTVSILCSLNPFFRYDGYWMYCDWFDLPNLRKQSKRLVVAIFHKKKQAKHEPFALIAYTIGNILFWTMLYYEVIILAITNIEETKETIKSGIVMESPALYKTIFSVITFLIILFFFLKTIFGIIKRKYHGSTRLCKPA